MGGANEFGAGVNFGEGYKVLRCVYMELNIKTMVEEGVTNK